MDFYRALKPRTYALYREYSFHQSSSLSRSFLRARRSQTDSDKLILHAPVSVLFQSTLQTNRGNDRFVNAVSTLLFIYANFAHAYAATATKRTFTTSFSVRPSHFHVHTASQWPQHPFTVHAVPSQFLVFGSLAHPSCTPLQNRLSPSHSPCDRSTFLYMQYKPASRTPFSRPCQFVIILFFCKLRACVRARRWNTD